MSHDWLKAQMADVAMVEAQTNTGKKDAHERELPRKKYHEDKSNWGNIMTSAAVLGGCVSVIVQPAVGTAILAFVVLRLMEVMRCFSPKWPDRATAVSKLYSTEGWMPPTFWFGVATFGTLGRTLEKLAIPTLLDIVFGANVFVLGDLLGGHLNLFL